MLVYTIISGFSGGNNFDITKGSVLETLEVHT